MAEKWWLREPYSLWVILLHTPLWIIEISYVISAGWYKYNSQISNPLEHKILLWLTTILKKSSTSSKIYLNKRKCSYNKISGEIRILSIKQNDKSVCSWDLNSRPSEYEKNEEPYHMKTCNIIVPFSLKTIIIVVVKSP